MSLRLVSPAAILLAIFGLTAHASPNSLGRRPFLGWSTWCTSGSCDQTGQNITGALHDFCDETMILSVAESLVSSGMRDAGFSWVSLDDCWCATSRDGNGDLQPDPHRFPSGIPSLVEKLHALNLSLSLYTSVGPTTCSSGNRSGSVPGSYGHYAQDAAKFVEWSVDGIKLDYCDWHFNETVLIPWTTTAAFQTALNETGISLWLNAHCVGYDLLETSWCPENLNSYRTGPDHHDNWPSTTDAMFFLAWHPIYVGSVTNTWPDPDFLMTGGAGCDSLTPGLRCPGQSDDEYRSEFTIWVIAGGQLVVASDPRNMSTLQQEVLLNSELLAVFTDELGTIGSCLRPAPEFLTLEVSLWVKPLSGSCAAVALLNGKDTPAPAGSASFLFEELGLGSAWSNTTTASVRDLWAHQTLPSATGGFYLNATLAPHASFAVKLCQV